MRTTVPMIPEAPDAAGYGLGIYYVALPCGKVWGHDGAVIGMLTISWHSEDGTRHFSFATNFSHYQLVAGLPHPIDLAVRNLYLTALCPGGSTAKAASPLPTQLPGALKLNLK
jgi:D-alanyl-D-alanine carboxypeptidase